MFKAKDIFITVSVFALYLPAVFGLIWKCNSNTGYCDRLQENSAITNSSSIFYSQTSCRLICGNNGIVWPKPIFYKPLIKSLVLIDPQQIHFAINVEGKGADFLNRTTTYFFKTLNKEYQSLSNCDGNNYALNVYLKVGSESILLNWDTDESYSLRINTKDSESRVEVNLTANTVYGARHGVETLLQLLVSFTKNDLTCLATIQQVEIFDSPVYRHRGLLLDTARNFLSLESIKLNIDAMAASKMNVLHWHITDSQSFAFDAPSLPNMTRYGAYSTQDIYSADDLRDIKFYALDRGVKVIPEIDAPAHVGNGWQWADETELGKLAVCVNQQPWKKYCIQPPCGQLNPANQNVYKILQSLYKDIVDIFPESNVFHMGGDEVKVDCWNSTQEIIDYISPKKRTTETFIQLWSEFQTKAAAAYDAAAGNNNTKLILWTSDLTEPLNITTFLPKDRYVIQSWEFANSLIPSQLIQLGYEIIISTKDKWYLDRGFWGTTTYAKWTDVYDNRIIKDNLVLGGEVCMWGELVDDSNVQERVWPRAAAAAERLWSNPSSTAQLAKNRFFLHVERLRRRGVRAAAVTPKYCAQNEDMCSNYL